MLINAVKELKSENDVLKSMHVESQSQILFLTTQFNELYSGMQAVKEAVLEN
jgi:hypothetical protein